MRPVTYLIWQTSAHRGAIGHGLTIFLLPLFLEGAAAMKVLFHLFMTFITGGLWLIYLFVRYVIKGR